MTTYSNRSKAIDKARKVFALGVSTIYLPEKESCFQRVIVILRDHNLVLYDLDPKFPRRLDIEILRIKIGLPFDSAQNRAKGSTEGERGNTKNRANGRSQESGVSGKKDPEVLLWLHLSVSERRYLLDGPIFSSSLLDTIRKTTGYSRLLAALLEKDRSLEGGRFGDHRLILHLEQFLNCSGKMVVCNPKNRTIFDDLTDHCLSKYNELLINKDNKSEKRHRKSQRDVQEEDLRSKLLQKMPAIERRRFLHGPLFSQGMLKIIQNTNAYSRLLTEMDSLNCSERGVDLPRNELLEWLRKLLMRQGSLVDCRNGSETLFEDIAAYCRFEYLKVTQQQREKARKQKQEEQEAENKRKQKEAEHKKDSTDEYEADFDDLAEAQLYLHIVRRMSGATQRIKSVSRGGKFFVEFVSTEETANKVEETHQQVFHDLQLAAERIRAEAENIRNKAITEIEIEYEEKCHNALFEAVKRYIGKK